jgi:hypothetical protein
VIFDGGDEVNWNVLGEFATGDYVMPAAPPEGDRSKKAAFISIKLQSGLDYQDVIEFNSTNLADLVELVETFSFTDVDEP